METAPAEPIQDALQNAEALLQPLAVAFNRPEPNRLDAVIAPQQLKAAVKALAEARWGYLSAITGLDHPAAILEEGSAGSQPVEAQGMVEALYHFCHQAAVTTLRVSVPYDHPVIPTICDLIPSATLYERELMELFGVVIEGTPSRQRLVLPDDWPEGIYPLRKSFTGFDQTARD